MKSKAFIPIPDKMTKPELDASRAFIADGLKRETWRKVDIVLVEPGYFVKREEYDNGQSPAKDAS